MQQHSAGSIHARARMRKARPRAIRYPAQYLVAASGVTRPMMGARGVTLPLSRDPGVSTFTLMSAEITGDGRYLLLVWRAATAPAVGSRGTPRFVQSIMAGKLVSLSTDTPLVVAGVTHIDPGDGSLLWHERFKVATDADIIAHDVANITVTALEGHLEDLFGNVSTEVNAFPVTNYSIAAADGTIARDELHHNDTPSDGIPGTTFYVAPGTSLGTATLASAQIAPGSPGHIPFTSLVTALDTVFIDQRDNGRPSNKAHHFRVLEGTVETVSSSEGIAIKTGGVNRELDKYAAMLIDTYWFDYPGTVGAEGVRPRYECPDNDSVTGFYGLTRPLGGGAPATVYNIVIHGLDIVSTKSNNRVAQGLSFYTTESLIVEECSFKGFNDNIVLLGAKGPGLFLRCFFLDAGTTADGRAQGAYGSENSREWHFHECLFDDNGGITGNHKPNEADRNHHIYWDEGAGNYPIHVGNCYFSKAGADSFHAPGGGTFLENVIVDGPMGGFLRSNGGAVRRNVFLHATDINDPGFARGYGFSTGGPQRGTLIQLNLFADTVGTDPTALLYGPAAELGDGGEEIIVECNSFINAGPIRSTTSLASEASHPRRYYARGNVVDVRGMAAVNAFGEDDTLSSYSWRDSDDNVAINTSGSIAIVNGVAKTKAEYRAICTGQETNSFFNGDVTLGTKPTGDHLGAYAATLSGVGSTRAQLLTYLRARGLRIWSTNYHIAPMLPFLRARFAPVTDTLPARSGVNEISWYGAGNETDPALMSEPAALPATTRPYRVLIFGNGAVAQERADSLYKTFYTNSAPSAFTGYYSAWSLDTPGQSPFTRTSEDLTRMALGVLRYSSRNEDPDNPFPGNAPDEALAYWYSTGTPDPGVSGAGQGCNDGLLVVLPNAAQEIIWDQTLAVADGQMFAKMTLDNTAQGVSPEWAEAGLRVTVMWHGPAPNASGALPIAGCPSIRVGYWRGSDSPTLSDATPVTTVAGFYSLTVEIPAGSELPRIGLFTGAGTPNKKCRLILVGAFWEVAAATEGTSLIVIGHPGFVTDGSQNGRYCGNDYTPFLEAFGGVDALVMLMSSDISAGTSHEIGIGNDTRAELLAGIGASNSVAEWTADDLGQRLTLGLGFTNEVHCPILLVSTWFSGYGDTLADARIIYDTYVDALQHMARNIIADDPGGHAYHTSHSRLGVLDFYHHGGSDGERQSTQDTILLGDFLEEPGLVNRGNYDAGTSYNIGDVVFAYDDIVRDVEGTPEYQYWRGITGWSRSLTNGNVGHAPPNVTHWAPIQFTELSATGRARYVDFIWQQIAAIDAAIPVGGGGRGNTRVPGLGMGMGSG